MALQNLSAGAGLMPLRPETPLKDLSPGSMQKMTPEQRAKAMKRAKKNTPVDQAALVTPASLFGGT